MRGDNQAPIYLDTTVFMDLIERASHYAAPINALLDAVAKRTETLVTSELTLAEVLAPSRQFGPRSSKLARALSAGHVVGIDRVVPGSQVPSYANR